MIFTYIASTDRTSDIERNSLSIVDELQKKANTCGFNVLSGTRPTENQDLQIFDGTIITNVAGAVITVVSTFSEALTNKFREGDTLVIGIGEATEEEVTILTIDSETQLTLAAAPIGAHVADERIGKKIFGGIIARVEDANVRLLTQIEYRVSGVDYTKIFDRKLINNAYENVDARYILNDGVNGTGGINYTKLIDAIVYADDAAIQAEWLEAGVGSNPTVDTTAGNFVEGESIGVFSWSGAGTATWDGSPTSQNASELTGVNSGAPTKGRLMIWANFASVATVTSFKVRIGSSNADYLELTFDLPTAAENNTVVYRSVKLTSGSVTGTPDWTAMDYSQLRIVATGASSVKLNGLRITELNAFTFYNFEPGLRFSDFRSNFRKPTDIIDRLAKFNQFFWYIDYNRDIHFFDQETSQAPIEITSTSNNFQDLKINVDTSNLKNRQVVRGGTKTSTSTYAQVVEGDGALREWILKSLFVNLSITLDNNTSTDTMEAGTNTTTINATGHGLAVGDHIVNRTRSNAVRQVLTVPSVDQFTVQAVASQTNGDTFSKFATAKTDGVEGLDDETLFDYMMNYNEKSVRASSGTATLTSGNFLRFAYNEVIPIRIQRTDNASVAAMKAIIGGDGIFDGTPITDRTIDSSTMASERAQAELEQYSNPIVGGSFHTDQEGLKAGQIIRVTDATRSINDDFLIQRVHARSVAGDDGSYWIYDVTFASSLFGIIEFFQKLLNADTELQVDEDEIVETFATEDTTITVSEANDLAPAEAASETPTVTITETSNTAVEFTPPFVWEPDGASNTRWNLFQWG